jgi:hypothetical protein
LDQVSNETLLAAQKLLGEAEAHRLKVRGYSPKPYSAVLTLGLLVRASAALKSALA